MDTARHIGIAPNTFRENACRYCLSILPVDIACHYFLSERIYIVFYYYYCRKLIRNY
jgi:hypothetical protein